MRHLELYVDGAFSGSRRTGSWAFCIVESGNRIHCAYGLVKDSRLIAMRNVGSEINAAVKGMLHVTSSQFLMDMMVWDDNYVITLYYDYEGLGAWPKGTWTPKKEITESYALWMRGLGQKHRIEYQKVKAHSGNKWNEHVDKLCKSLI